ncbi:iron ABC transporter substrate-binding protein [Amaricoccus sp.]|uniref:iron ABC transporter substrate-binding protein n=1 Tax=Amaricoccus sp. TaxID=1872485 RepID=UPI002605A7A2|nr:iron ABC transporter substrate-binding protein [Amaricoccus sp.]HRO13300.1 iron ABC transporter substrate-binding protein [Amaricoccus sp.]
MLRRSFLTAVAFLLALAAPGLSQTRPSQTRPFTDAAGRTVEVPAAPQRVLAAGPPASVLLYALAPEKMVGWVREPSAVEKEYLAAPYRDLPTYGRLTGRGNTANIEMVLGMQPDLILDVGSVDETYASLADRVQAQTGIPYVLVDGSFARTPETLREVGALLGVPDAAEALAAFAEAAIARLEARVAAIPLDQRPRVYYGRGPDGLETGLAGSINMEVLDAVGATNVAAAAGWGGLANVSVEQVLAWDPDVILTQNPDFHAGIAGAPVWGDVAAVREGRVYRVPALPFGWFDTPPGINRIIGVDWLANVLYPEASDDDLRERTRAFYQLFYHVELTDAQLDTLLADAAP